MESVLAELVMVYWGTESTLEVILLNSIFVPGDCGGSVKLINMGVLM